MPRSNDERLRNVGVLLAVVKKNLEGPDAYYDGVPTRIVVDVQDKHGQVFDMLFIVHEVSIGKYKLLPLFLFMDETVEVISRYIEDLCNGEDLANLTFSAGRLLQFISDVTSDDKPGNSFGFSAS